MASYTPPTENLPIFDNAVFQSTNDSTTLTVGLANLLYLRKTFADTCTALETFNAGIAVNSIEATVPTTGSITIGSTQTNGILNIGSGARTATGVINIATGSGAGNVNILSGVGTSGGLNIGTAATGTNTVPVSINTGNQSGAINMGNSGNVFQVNSGTINIGTIPTSCQVVLLGQDAAIGNVKLATGSGVNTASVQIANGTTTGAVTIGNSANAVQINGAVTLAKPLILGSVPTLNTQLGFIINSALTASVVLATNNAGTQQSITSFTLPIGTWQCSYQIRYYNPTGSTTMTAQNSYMYITTRQTNYGTTFGWNGNYGVNWTITSAGVFAAQGSATIYTSVSNTLTLYTESTYTGTTALNAYSDAIGNIQTYLMAVRIG